MLCTPKVSVVIPAYNVQSYIEECLSSLENQSLKEFEALIVDDGSTDNTASIAKGFTRKDTRFKLLQKPNGGLSSARNHGIRHVSSDCIALLDADDTYHPDKLISHISVLHQKPEVGVVYSASRAIRDDGQLTPIQISGKPIYADALSALLCKNFIGHGSNAVFRRSVFDQVGEFNETLNSCEDLDFWLRVAETKDWHFFRVAKTLCYYRVRPSGLSFNVTQMQRTQMQVMESAYSRCPEAVGPMLATAEAYMYRYLARLSLASGDLDTATSFIHQAIDKDGSIFYRDFRSFLTLAAVKLSPISQPMIKRALGSERSAAGKAS